MTAADEAGSNSAKNIFAVRKEFTPAIPRVFTIANELPERPNAYAKQCLPCGMSSAHLIEFFFRLGANDTLFRTIHVRRHTVLQVTLYDAKQQPGRIAKIELLHSEFIKAPVAIKV